MNHGYFQDRLSAYLDHELKAEEYAALAQHLEECAECRAELDRLRELDRLVAEQSPLGDSDYWEASARKIEERLGFRGAEVIEVSRLRRTRSMSGWWWKVPAIAASVVLVGYIGLHESDILKDELLIPTQEQQAPKPGEDNVDTSTRGVLETTKPDEKAAATREAVEAEQPDTMVQRAAAGPSETGKGTATMKREDLEAISPSPTVPATGLDTSREVSREEEAAESRDMDVRIIDRKELPAVSPPVSPAEDTANYRQKSRTRIAATPDSMESDGIVRAPEPSAMALTQAAPPDSGLARWRAIRDSLLGGAGKSEMSDSAERGAVPKYSAVRPKDLISGFTQKKKPVAAVASAPTPQLRLLEAWYWVCRLSDDSLEVGRGREYLDSVAIHADPATAITAQAYLDRLEYDR